MRNQLVISGAREHNLKNVNLSLPRDTLIVFTGLSGSGKSSLAFDTIYAEGQRRYVESLSSYARQFLGQMNKPDVDSIDGLSPAIAIDQKTTTNNPRSTVGTVTEIYDYFRLLYARIGIPHCPQCGREITQQSVDQMIERIMALGEGTKIQILAPVVRHRKGEYNKLFDDMIKQGFVRARIDKEIYELSERPTLNKQQKHTIEIVVDRLIIKDKLNTRLTDSIETAAKMSSGLVVVNVVGGEDIMFSQNYACPDCGISIEELTPRMFSFNSPFGACPTCTGLGVLTKVDPDQVLPDKTLSLNQGAIALSGWNSSDTSDSLSRMYLEALAEKYAFSLDTPVGELPQNVIDIILYGTKGEKMKVKYERENGSGSFMAPFEGVVTNLERRYHETSSDAVKEGLEEYMAAVACPACGGKKLKPESLSVTVGGVSITDMCDMSIRAMSKYLANMELTQKQKLISGQILKEITARLGFLSDVGLGYLTLSRQANTLSGGEAQRIRLATQIGSSLVGVLYILDEPSIGLHQSDNRKLLATLCRLRDIGNTLIVVEHDEETMRAADLIVDIGPGAGSSGGNVVAVGTAEELEKMPGSITGLYLSGKMRIKVPKTRRAPTGWITVKNARANNLKNVTVDIPLGVITCVTGVSGSGKSSLINEILYKSLARTLNRAKTKPGPCDGITGVEQLDKIIQIDQSPIGRTPRSNPATYTGLFNLIRDVFASTPDAKARGYQPNRFSFNVKGGRCEACQGDGIIKIEMHFLPDVYVPCEVCGAKRYNRETLEVKYKGKSIYDVLEMTVDEALTFFEPIPKIASKLETMRDVGLGYVKLGQPSTELSGGEAQRIKLATELARKATGRTIYVFDEPTTGLHMADVDMLNRVFERLADAGNTLIIIEHNLDVIKIADYVIDIGPEGGDEGGEIVVKGTPEQISKQKKGHTAEYIRKALERDKELAGKG